MPSPALRRLWVPLCIVCACAGERPSSPASDVAPPVEAKSSDAAPAEASPQSPPPAAPAEPSGTRLDAAAIATLGDPPDSPCKDREADGLEVAGCKVRGPNLGAIEGGTKLDEVEGYRAALDACAAEPSCIGISSRWYMGAPWYPVSGASSFAIDTDSYACTMVLDCN